MKIAVIGRGNVGGGLADLWEGAGHELQRIGQEGSDVSEAEAVLVAVPGAMIAEALDNVHGLEGKTVIDATNLVGAEPPKGFSSNAEYVKSRTNGPTAKSFNANFASLYERIGEASSTPSRHRAICGAATRRHGRSSSSLTVMQAMNRSTRVLWRTPQRRRTSSSSSGGSHRGGWAHSCIGWRPPIDSDPALSRIVGCRIGPPGTRDKRP
jgi:hypothetical protein